MVVFDLQYVGLLLFCSGSAAVSNWHTHRELSPPRFQAESMWITKFGTWLTNVRITFQPTGPPTLFPSRPAKF